MSRLAKCLLVVGVAGAVAACGSSSAKSETTTTSATAAKQSTGTSSTTAAAAKDAPAACELVTKPQADAAMGTTMLDGVPVENADTDTCTYAGDPNGPTAQLEVFVGDGAKKFYDDDLNVLQHTFTDVPGLGDESHEEEYTIFFRKGTTWVALRITSLDDWATFQARAESLAQEVAAQL